MPPKTRKPGENADLSDGKIVPMGVGIHQGEVTALDEIARAHGVTRNALLHFAVRKFLIDYRRGGIDLTPMIEVPPEPKKKLILPE